MTFVAFHEQRQQQLRLEGLRGKPIPRVPPPKKKPKGTDAELSLSRAPRRAPLPATHVLALGAASGATLSLGVLVFVGGLRRAMRWRQPVANT